MTTLQRYQLFIDGAWVEKQLEIKRIKESI